MARPTAFLRRCADRYGDVFTIRVSTTGAPMVLTTDTDLVRRLFTEYADVARGGSSTTLEPFVGSRSILLLDGAEHLRQRRLILPPLHGETMRAQAPLVADLAERELASWPRGEPVATLPRMRALTLEVVLRLVFGARDRAEVAAHVDLSEEDVLEAMDAFASYRVRSLDAPASARGDDERPYDVATIDGGFDRVESEMARRRTVTKLIGTLADDDRELVRLYYGEGLSQTEVADKLGVSQVSVSRHLRRVLSRLRVVAATMM
jgi:RNA polymerase sigma factor (sigma-70 family)